MSTTGLIEEIERMSVLDLVSFKKTLEDRWGILLTESATLRLPDAVDVPAWREEQTDFTVMLASFGANKIAVIKAVRELTTLGLKEAKALVESAPVAVRDGMPKDEAGAIALKLRDAGAMVEIT